MKTNRHGQRIFRDLEVWEWVEFDHYYKQEQDLTYSEMTCMNCKEDVSVGGFVHEHEHRDGDGSILQLSQYFKCLPCGIKETSNEI